MKLALLEALNAERVARKPCIVVTNLANGDARLIKAETLVTESLNGTLLGEALATGLRTGKSAVLVDGEDRFFLQVDVPPVKLIDRKSVV